MFIMNSAHNTNVDVFDPWANKKVQEEFGISLIENWEQKHYEAVFVVAHNEFKYAILKTKLKFYCYIRHQSIY